MSAESEKRRRHARKVLREMPDHAQVVLAHGGKPALFDYVKKLAAKRELPRGRYPCPACFGRGRLTKNGRPLSGGSLECDVCSGSGDFVAH